MVATLSKPGAVVAPPPIPDVGDSVCLVFTRMEALPAIVTALGDVDDNGCTIDLETSIPVESGHFNKAINRREVRVTPVHKTFQGVRWRDPLRIDKKVARKYFDDHAAKDLITDDWVDSGKRLRHPDFEKLMPGTWFDPTSFVPHLRLRLFKSSFKDESDQRHPEELEIRGPYRTYAELYDDFYKERWLGAHMSKGVVWDGVGGVRIIYEVGRPVNDR